MKKVIIIGGGIAGLSAGIFSQINGFESIILEKIYIIAHSGHIKGLNNIFLSGQWLQPPGGLPVDVVTGKDTIMRLCKREKQIFISTMLSFEA